MDVALHVPLDAPPAVDAGLDDRAGGADGERRGDVERDVVRPEVGVELRQVVKREVRPRPVGLEARELGEPLADHVKVIAVARALDDDRELVVERDVEIDRLAGRDVARQGDAGVGLVLVAGPVKLDAGEQVRRWRRRARGARGLRTSIEPHDSGGRAPAAPDALAKEGGAVVLEGVQVEVQPELVHRPRARVPPVDGALAVRRCALRGRASRAACSRRRRPRGTAGPCRAAAGPAACGGLFGGRRRNLGRRRRG